MSGYYNYHPTIAEPQTFAVQTASQQAPFHFGGSQVPINLHPEKLIKESQSTGSGLKHIGKVRYIPRTPFRKV